MDNFESASTATPSGATLADARLRLDPSDLGALEGALGARPLRFTHSVAGHEALEPPAITALIERLPAGLVEHHCGDLPLVLAAGDAERLDLDPVEVARSIEDNGSWFALWHLEGFAPFDTMTTEVIDQVRGLAERREGEVSDCTATIFFAGAEAVVPVHTDRRHNLLLQTEGTKTVVVGTYRDPVVGQREIERVFDAHAENPHVLPEDAVEFELGPGDGLYVPPDVFHWVRNGSSQTVSLSVAFHTAASLRRMDVHAANLRLRRRGLRPHGPGSSARDALKVLLLRLVRLRHR